MRKSERDMGTVLAFRFKRKNNFNRLQLMTVVKLNTDN